MSISKTPAGRPVRPQVVNPPDRSVPEPIRKVAWFLDECIRIGPGRIGFDGLLGLIPGVGDLLGSAFGAWIILSAARDGVPRATLARMLANVAIDTVLGTVPFLGDLFDFLYKSNTKNLRLYEQALEGRNRPGSDALFVGLVVVGVLLILALPVVLLVLILRAVLR